MIETTRQCLALRGPYQVEECHERGIFNKSLMVTALDYSDPEQEKIVICRLPTGLTDTRWGTAKLLSAAPELLEALVEIYTWTEHKNTPWAERAQAAIRKATEAI